MATSVGNLAVILSANTKRYSKGMRRARTDTSRFTDTTSKMSTSVSSAFLKIGAAATAFIGVSKILRGLGTGFKLAAEYEQAQVAMTTMTGSAETANKVLQDLTKFAAATPFEFPALQEGAKKLLAFGESAENIVPTMKVLGDVAAGVGAPVDELAVLYGKARVQGRLMAEDVNQLTERGIPIIGEFAKQFGVAESEVRNLVSEGKVGFPQLQQAMVNLTSEGGQFAGLMKAQSSTLGGLFSTLRDNVGLALRNIASTMVEAFDLKGAMSNVISFISSIQGIVKGAVQSIASVTVSMFRTVSAWWARVREGVLQSAIVALKAVLSVTLQYARMSIAAVKALAGAFATGFKIIGGLLSSFSQMLGLGGSSFVDFKNVLIASLAIVEFSFMNWEKIVDLAVTKIILGVVRLGAQVKHVLTDTIPTVLVWIADNWRDIFTTMADFTATTFENMGKNIVAFFSNIKGLIDGTVDLADIWTPLTDGFESTIKDLPNIADREKGSLEKSLEKDVESIAGPLSEGLDEHLAKRLREAGAVDKTVDEIAENIGKALGMEGEGEGLKIPDLKLEESSKDVLKKNNELASGQSATAETISLSRAVLNAGPARSKKQEVKDPEALEELKQIKEAVQARAMTGVRVA